MANSTATIPFFEAGEVNSHRVTENLYRIMAFSLCRGSLGCLSSLRASLLCVERGTAQQQTSDHEFHFSLSLEGGQKLLGLRDSGQGRSLYDSSDLIP